jgi:flavin reductase (DIM6/NTAB) family NADH-FMN oxidoreductase RutF
MMSDHPTTDHKPRALLSALGRIPSGLFVLTARRGDASTGTLVSWVQQCSFDPPQVTVALGRGRDVSAWLTDGTVFALNILAEGQGRMLSHFGKGFAAGAPAFVGVDVETSAEGLPVLPAALAHLECRVAGRVPVGDHDLLIARVIGGKVHHADARPMVHVRKSGGHY